MLMSKWAIKSTCNSDRQVGATSRPSAADGLVYQTRFAAKCTIKLLMCMNVCVCMQSGLKVNASCKWQQHAYFIPLFVRRSFVWLLLIHACQWVCLFLWRPIGSHGVIHSPTRSARLWCAVDCHRCRLHNRSYRSQLPRFLHNHH